IVRDPCGRTPAKATEILTLWPRCYTRITYSSKTVYCGLMIVRAPCGRSPAKATEILTLCPVAIRESRIAATPFARFDDGRRPCDPAAVEGEIPTLRFLAIHESRIAATPFAAV